MCHFKEHEALLLDLRHRISTSTQIVSTACRMSESRKKIVGRKSVCRDLLPTLLKYCGIQMRTRHTYNDFTFFAAFITHVRDLFDVYF